MRALRSPAVPILLAILLSAFGCARSFNPDVERGSMHRFRQGYPEVRLSAVGFLDAGNETRIQVTADIVYNSVVFRKRGDEMRSDLSLEAVVYARESDEVVYARRMPIDQVADSYRTATSQDVFTWVQTVDVNPGRYQIDVTVFDHNTGRHLTRTAHTSVPDPATPASSVTNIRMYVKRTRDGPFAGRWKPNPTYDIPGRIDSLKFVFQVVNKADDPLVIDSELLKFNSDTLPARPIHARDYSPSSLRFKGLEYDERETVQSTRRILAQKGKVDIEYFFPMLERGNYRFEVHSRDGDETHHFKARDFSIKSRNFPTLVTARELGRPLVYLMDDKEYHKLLSMRNADTLKAEVDRFWLKHVGNRSDARSVIRLFYERVEVANKRFSNYKEGWKTDRGMVFILFGPPIYVEEIHETVHWYYSYNRENPRYHFIFKRRKFKSEYYPFDNLILQRKPDYYNLEYQQVRLWLSGQILFRKI